MNCNEAKELYSDYLDRRLTPFQNVLFREHVDGCAACRQDVANLQRTVDLIGSLDEIEAAPDFLAGVERKIDGRWGRLRRALFEPLKIKIPLEAAALLLVGSLAVLVYHRSSDQEYALVARMEQQSPRATVSPEMTEKKAETHTDREARQGYAELSRERLEKKSEAEPRSPAKGDSLSAQAPNPPLDMIAPEPPAAIAPAPPRPATPPASQPAAPPVTAKPASPPASSPPAARMAPPAAGDGALGRALQAPAAKPSASMGTTLEQSKRVETRIFPVPQIIEVAADQPEPVGNRVRSLVPEMGGKILNETATEGGLTISIELPESRQTEFATALEKETGAAPAERPDAFKMPDLLSGERSVARSRSTEETSLQKGTEPAEKQDDPVVTFEVRIQPKK